MNPMILIGHQERSPYGKCFNRDVSNDMNFDGHLVSELYHFVQGQVSVEALF